MGIKKYQALFALLAVALAGCSEHAGRSTRGAITESTVARRAIARWHAKLPIGAGVAKGFVQDGSGRLRPRFGKRTSAVVALPARAAGTTRVADAQGDVALEFALAGATRARVQVSSGLAWYGGAGPGGGDLMERAAPNGVEDFIAFRKRPAVEQLEYRVRLSRVAGLRLVANTLELLDADGSPRLRVAPPYVMDSRGKRVAASLSLADCAADTNPRGPWDRPVTPPGARSCTVRVKWQGVEYPAVVDPGWTTTGSMSTARRQFGAARLSNGRVLVMGGQGTNGQYLSSCELYDPSTGTWAAASNLKAAQYNFTTTTLTSGDVLIAGGNPMNTLAQRYDPQSGSWSLTGSLNTGRIGFGATLLGDGRVMVAGGATSQTLKSVEIYNPPSGQWFSASDMATARVYLTLTTLGDGRVLAAGGETKVTGGTALATAELYDPASSSWSAAPSMLDARYGQNAVALASGDALIIGGSLNAPLATAERFGASSSTWSAAGVTAQARFRSSAALMADGRVLVSGGVRSFSTLLLNQTAEIYDPTGNGWSSAGFMSDPRQRHTTTLLADGRLLIAGGDQGHPVLSSSEIYDPGTTGTGGTGGSGGSAGTGGTAGSGGTGGSGGSAGTGGNAGAAGSGGTTGTGGLGGSAGMGGSGGSAATGGGAGTAGAAGAGGTPVNDGGATACVPQQQVECACGGGVKGYQVCRADGMGYDACVCKSASTSNNDGGCGCHEPGRAPTNDSGLLLLVAATLLATERRGRVRRNASTRPARLD